MQEASGTDTTNPKGSAQLSSFDPVADQLPNFHCHIRLQSHLQTFRVRGLVAVSATRLRGGRPRAF